MKSGSLKTAVIAIAAAAGGLVLGAGLFHAQAVAAGVAEPQTVPTAAAPTATTMTAAPAARAASGPAVAGSLQVTRLTDTTFVVVKDQGDAEVVTLFSTEGGIVQKKHSGRFFY